MVEGSVVSFGPETSQSCPNTHSIDLRQVRSSVTHRGLPGIAHGAVARCPTKRIINQVAASRVLAAMAAPPGVRAMAATDTSGVAICSKAGPCCPFRADQLFVAVASRAGADGLLQVGAAGELQSACDDSLWILLCREGCLGVWSGRMSEEELCKLREFIQPGDWRRLFLQSRHLEPVWSKDLASRTALQRALPLGDVPSTLIMRGSDLLFVEIYFTCTPGLQKLVKPSACREVVPLDLTACASTSTSEMRIPLHIAFSSRLMEFSDRYCSTLELRLCARIDGRMVLLADTAIDQMQTEDDVDRDGVGTYERALRLSHKGGLELWLRFAVRRVNEARTTLFNGKPKRFRAGYMLTALSLDDNLQVANEQSACDARGTRPQHAAAFRNLFCP